VRGVEALKVSPESGPAVVVTNNIGFTGEKG